MLNSGVQEAKKENNMRKVLVIVTMMLTVCVTAFGQEDGLIGMMTSEQEYSDWANFNIQWNPCTLVPKSGDSKSFTGISVGLESCGSLFVCIFAASHRVVACGRPCGIQRPTKPFVGLAEGKRRLRTLLFCDFKLRNFESTHRK